MPPRTFTASFLSRTDRTGMEQSFFDLPEALRLIAAWIDQGHKGRFAITVVNPWQDDPVTLFQVSR